MARPGDLELLRRELPLEGDDARELFHKEPVDLRRPADPPHRRAPPQQLGDGEQPLVGRIAQNFPQLRVGRGVELFKPQAVRARLEAAHRLEQALLEGAPDRHDLARRLHLGGEQAAGLVELVEGEARDFGDHVVERGLEARGGVGEGDLVEGKAHRDERRHPRDRVAARLARQRGGAGDAGVHLDHVVAEGVGVERELHVAAPLDAQRADEPQGGVPQHVVLLIGEGLARADDDRIPRVDAHRVDVLHVADGERRVVSVPDDLVFDLLVALDALFDEHLPGGRKAQGVFRERTELPVVFREAPARAAEGEGGAQDHRIADGARLLIRLRHRRGDVAREGRLPRRRAELLEELAVLGALDRVEAGAEDFAPALPQHPLFGELHGEVEPRLAAEGRQERVGAFLADDARHKFQRERLDIDAVGDVGVGHDRRRVGVDEHDGVARLPQREAGLGARVVELGRLADDDRPRADYENFADISTLRHPGPPSLPKTPRSRR